MNQLSKDVAIVAGVGVGAWLLMRAARKRYDFRDKAVLITGGSRGLGLIMARRLAACGARVAVCARDVDELDRAGDDLAGYGQWPLVLACDVTNAEQVRDLVQAVEAHFGCLDVLINNAGIIQAGPLEVMTREDFEEALNINFWGAYNAVEAALPGMRRRGQGRIVNICSIGGKIPVPHLLPYCASKFALVGYSGGLRAELAKAGIVVTTVCPGLMRTGSPPNALFKGNNKAEYTWFSISDSLPLLSMNADKAAEQILAACARGDAEITLTLPAKLAARLNALFPNTFATLLELTNRLLPAPGAHGHHARLGMESQSFLSPSVLTGLSDSASERNNEVAPGVQ